MAKRAVGYPIMHTVRTGTGGSAEYKISLKDGEVVYSGRVYGKGEEDKVEFDISDICSEYLDTTYEDMNIDGAVKGEVKGTCKTFIVTPSAEGDGSYEVIYNYNTDYEHDDISGNFNYPVSKYADPGQVIGLSGTAGTFTWAINGQKVVDEPSALSGAGINLFQVSLAEKNLKAGDVVSLTYEGAGGSGKVTHTYEVLPGCGKRYVLLYVNKAGGLDYLLCAGRPVENWSTRRTTARLYNDRSKRKSFDQSVLYQEVERSYELKTGLLTEEGAANIDHLLFSPKVWVQDLTTGSVTACTITDSNITIQTHRQNGFVGYTINVTESQTYRRR